MADVRKQKKAVTRKPSAIKRARQYEKRWARNRSMTSQMRNQIKKLRNLLASNNKQEAKNLLKPALATIAKMTSKGILHKNTAARYTSRLTKQVNHL